MLLALLIILFMNTMNQCILFAKSHLVKEMVIPYSTLFTNIRLEFSLHSNDISPLYLVILRLLPFKF